MIIFNFGIIYTYYINIFFFLFRIKHNKHFIKTYDAIISQKTFDQIILSICAPALVYSGKKGKGSRILGLKEKKSVDFLSGVSVTTLGVLL